MFFKAPKYRELARGMIKEVIEGKKNTSYTNDHIYKASSDGQYLFDCSGFIRYILTETGYTSALNEIANYVRNKKRIEIDRIFTYDFFDFFEEVNIKTVKSKRWSVIPSNKSLKRGDIVVWLGINLGSPTEGQQGHIVVIDEVIKKTKEYVIVRVIDCTASLHQEDSRSPYGSGIGTGLISFYLDDKGYFVGLRSDQNILGIESKQFKVARL